MPSKLSVQPKRAEQDRRLKRQREAEASDVLTAITDEMAWEKLPLKEQVASLRAAIVHLLQPSSREES